jgi:hypothetical protein
MSMHRPPRAGWLVCAIALLLASCSSSGGSAGSSAPVPHGLAGTGKHHRGQHSKHHHRQTNRPGKHNRQGGRPTSGSPRPAATSSSSTRPRSAPPAQHTSSAPSGGGGGGGHSHTSGPPAHQPSGPTVSVSPHTALRDGQTVTVEGFGFAPNTLLAVAECRDRGTDTNLSDCNINSVITYAPGKRVRSDANGHVGPLQLGVSKSFKSVDCATERCLVAISEPRLDPDPADEGDQYIKFQ